MRALLPLISCLAVASCDPRPAPASQTSAPWDMAPGFWIWNRAAALPAASVAHLSDVDAHRLYWQLADIRPGQPPSSDARLVPIRDSAAIPVIRLPSGAGTLADKHTLAVLRHWCGVIASDLPQKRLQIDYDCPTASLDGYAMLLKRLRAEFGIDTLSVTALASWIDAPDFARFSSAVDELVPMFYDLAADAPEDITAGTPLRMIDETTLRWIAKWGACRRSWRVGLPNFQRLSIFEPDGTLVGHLQDWAPESILAHPLLRRFEGGPAHTIRFQVTKQGIVSRVAVRPGQHIVWRMPDEGLTRHALTAARDAGATGAVWFAHPDSAPVAWHSAPHLSMMARGNPAAPALAIRFLPDGSVRIVNEGPGDLPSRYHTTPWSLVLEAEGPGSFGSASPGTFFSLEAAGASLAQAELAGKIELSFHSLRIDQERRTAPQFIATPETLPTWRIQPTP